MQNSAHYNIQYNSIAIYPLVVYTLPIECKGMTADIMDKYFAKPYAVLSVYTFCQGQGYIHNSSVAHILKFLLKYRLFVSSIVG